MMSCSCKLLGLTMPSSLLVLFSFLFSDTPISHKFNASVLIGFWSCDMCGGWLFWDSIFIFTLTSGCLYLLFPWYGFLFSGSYAFPLIVSALGFLPDSVWCAPLLLLLHNGKFCVLTLTNYCWCESDLWAADLLIHETPTI